MLHEGALSVDRRHKCHPPPTFEEHHDQTEEERLIIATQQDGRKTTLIIIIRASGAQKEAAAFPRSPPTHTHNPIERLLAFLMIYKVTSQTDLL